MMKVMQMLSQMFFVVWKVVGHLGHSKSSSIFGIFSTESFLLVFFLLPVIFPGKIWKNFQGFIASKSEYPEKNFLGGNLFLAQ